MATIYLKRPNKTNQSITPTRIFNDVSQEAPFWWTRKYPQSTGQNVVGRIALPPSRPTSIYGIKSDLFERAKLTWQESFEANQKKIISPLGERLRRRREAILASGIPLLDWDGIEREKFDRRGGYQGE